ncbi:hypothetical protein ALC60_09880 [Trachymyrmex zeteki]|uniref:Uncharacterized protein n=1 Tax=Mycetomoellerius zeteki TaxID=64791 RepID=A0A151WT39_9HYME|nr:hypothetical protein ALC60_09880 [Trachymyrmex zeteki]
MDEHEILLLPPFSGASSKERTRKKLWRSAVEIVASDDEDSDADEHECAFFPAKRHCTQLSKANEACSDTEQHTSTETPASNVGNLDYDEIIYQIQIEEKLKLWQAFQEEEGSMDNSINEVLAYYRMMHPPDPLEEESVGSRFHMSYRGNDMEDTAVTMAIRNHGLVQSAELPLQPHYCKCIGVDCSFSSKCMYELEDFPYGAVYSNIETGRCNALDTDKVYECDQPEDFLERAVDLATLLEPGGGRRYGARRRTSPAPAVRCHSQSSVARSSSSSSAGRSVRLAGRPRRDRIRLPPCRHAPHRRESHVSAASPGFARCTHPFPSARLLRFLREFLAIFFFYPLL